MHVEFLGIPRERVGVSDVAIEAQTLGELLTALRRRFPSFADLLAADRLHPSVTANLNGDRFVSDPGTPLAAGDHLLILSADVGG